MMHLAIPDAHFAAHLRAEAASDCNRPLAVSRQLRGHPFERGGRLLESAQDGVGDARREIVRQVRVSALGGTRYPAKCKTPVKQIKFK